MKKTQKELLLLGKTKRNQQGATLVEIAGWFVVAVIVLSLIVFYAPKFKDSLTNPTQAIKLAESMGIIKRQVMLIEVTTGGCLPKLFGYVTTEIPTAENNTCGTSAKQEIPLPISLKIVTTGGSNAEFATLPLIHKSITLSFEEVGSTDPKALMLKVVSDQNIMDNLINDRLCPIVERTDPNDNPISECHYESGKLYYLMKEY